MKRETLKELGLTDEQIDKVMAEHGNTVTTLKKDVEKVEALQEEVNDYKQQIADRDTQLDELSKKATGNEELTAQINELKQQNDTTKSEYEKKLQDQAFNHTLENSLSGAKAKNTKAVKALLDMDMIKLDGESLKGLDDQLKTLKEKEPYLFKEDEKDPVPNYTTNDHKGGTSAPTDAFASKLAKYN